MQKKTKRKTKIKKNYGGVKRYNSNNQKRYNSNNQKRYIEEIFGKLSRTFSRNKLRKRKNRTKRDSRNKRNTSNTNYRKKK